MTFICTAKPSYDWEKTIRALEPHEFQQWRNRALSMRKHIKPDDNQASFRAPHTYDGLLMDADEIAAWNEAGVEMHISRVKGLASNARELSQTIFQVHVANIGLLQIQCVEVLEDCCTYELQKWLDRGWRIIAVCPPNDTRRPTYVLGHVDKEPHQ